MLLSKCALAPLLTLQAKHVRRVVRELPEPGGMREGFSGIAGGKILRLLVVGDSSGAGVGVALQQDALAAQLARNLAASIGGAVRWRLMAATGKTARSSMKFLAEASAEPADVLILCLGANDVLRQTGPRAFLAAYRTLVEELRAKIGARLVVVNGLPPMHVLPSLPQPLRWYLGRCAHRLDAELRRYSAAEQNLRFLSLQWAAVAEDLAEDRFHPGIRLYREWARRVAETIAEWSIAERRFPKAGALAHPI